MNIGADTEPPDTNATSMMETLSCRDTSRYSMFNFFHFRRARRPSANGTTREPRQLLDSCLVACLVACSLKCMSWKCLLSSCPQKKSRIGSGAGFRTKARTAPARNATSACEVQADGTGGIETEPGAAGQMVWPNKKRAVSSAFFLYPPSRRESCNYLAIILRLFCN